MDPSFLFFLALAVVILILFIIGAVFLLPKLLKNLTGGGGGWTLLTGRFQTAVQTPKEVYKRQTVQVGKVVYKRCTTVGIMAEGLYLESTGPFTKGLKPLLIPWDQIRGLREGNLYWEKTHVLSIGQPEIGTVSIFSNIFKKIRPYLNHLL
ncbi:MAG: hypothetical protein AB1585_17205 [Thermodesulfobacteriota bacterium]